MYGATKLSNIIRLESAQNKAIRNLIGLKFNAHTSEHYIKLKQLRAAEMITASQLLVAYKFRLGLLPSSLSTTFKYANDTDSCSIRENSLNLYVPPAKGLFPIPEIAQTWNRIPYANKLVFKVTQFKSETKHLLLSKYSLDVCSEINCYSCKQSAATYD